MLSIYPFVQIIGPKIEKAKGPKNLAHYIHIMELCVYKYFLLFHNLC